MRRRRDPLDPATDQRAARYRADWQTSNARELWIVDSRGSWEAQVTSGDSFDANPAWAPDGSRIVFERHAWAGTCRQFALVLRDGTYHYANVRLTK